MGGQIMPPVMGAVAFIMAENLNVPYAEIVKAAVVCGTKITHRPLSVPLVRTSACTCRVISIISMRR